MTDDDELQSVRERYARRAPQDPRYSLLNPSALLALQGRQRAICRAFVAAGWHDLSTRTLAEVGSGDGGNLLDFIRLGFAPANLAGIELLEARHAAARQRLPAAVRLVQGDAAAEGAIGRELDLVFQATVFSSLLDPAFQQRLADAMWRALKPGGAVLWYDFTVDNPRNRDVRGVPLARVRALFPEGRLRHRRLTLAPPLARAAVRVGAGLYTLLDALPPLRTHLMCWIAKPASSPLSSRP
jgi:SAM-dependent methyltransferase